MDSVHDLAPFYVLDALDEGERTAFEAHLPGCADCRRQIAELGPGIEALARLAAESPPPAMKAEVMAAIDADRDGEPEDRAGSEATSIRPRATMVVASLVAVAAALAIVFGVGLGSSDPDRQPIDSILAAADRSVVVVESDLAPFVEVVYVPDEGSGVFIAEGIDSLPEGRTYQLWLIGVEGPVSAGTFQPDEDGTARVLFDGEVRPGLTVGLTIEPSGGSPAPTGDILLAQEI